MQDELDECRKINMAEQEKLEDAIRDAEAKWSEEKKNLEQ